MESRFDHDFSTVRVHADGPAQEMSDKLGARAFTVGDRVFLGRRAAPLPDVAGEQRLLAHELAHVVQQRRGGPARPSIDASGPLERAADTAAAAVTGRGRVSVVGASSPAVMCQPDDRGRRETDDDEHSATSRLRDKEQTARRKAERASAGRDPADMSRAQAEHDLAKLERSYRQPGATSRSAAHKEADLKRYTKLLNKTDAPQIGRNARQGAFDELQRTSTGAAGKPQTKHVAGGPELPGQDLPAGRSSYAQPDYSVRSGGRGKVKHVNLKSDDIGRQTLSKARATARRYLEQALKNARHLADEEEIVLSFARRVKPEIRKAMTDILLTPESPVGEVRFGTTAIRKGAQPTGPGPPTKGKAKSSKASRPTKPKAGAKSTRKPGPSKPKAGKPKAKPTAERATSAEHTESTTPEHTRTLSEQTKATGPEQTTSIGSEHAASTDVHDVDVAPHTPSHASDAPAAGPAGPAPASTEPAPAAPTAEPEVKTPSGGANVGEKVMGGAAAAAVVGDVIVKLHEGHLAEAAETAGVAGAVTWALKRAPELAPIAVMMATIDAYDDKVKAHSMSSGDWVQAHTSFLGETPSRVVGGLAASAEATAESLFQGTFGTVGRGIGEGAAVVYIRLSSDEYTLLPWKAEWWPW